MGCFDSTLNKRNCNFLIFRLTRKQFWKCRSHTEQRSTRKAYFKFDLLDLEIAFFSENEMTVFANQNTLCAFIICFKFPFLHKTCKRNKSHEFANEKVACKLAGS